ncbi:hypothetical protein B0H11DRAFT_975603 [Mycena galericulata]|nr:hypothetical protein B0H11DRAFT_975603 [Mycena galericulata]
MRASPAVSTAALHPHGHPAHSPPEPKTKSRLALEEEEEEDDEEEGKGEASHPHRWRCTGSPRLRPCRQSCIRRHPPPHRCTPPQRLRPRRQRRRRSLNPSASRGRACHRRVPRRLRPRRATRIHSTLGEWGYGHEERERERERESESERDYAVVERAGGWDVLPAAAVAGAASQAGYARTSAAANAHASTSKCWETEEDVDVLGDVDMDSHTEHARGTQRRERVPEHPLSRDPEMEPAQEAICPPKMRKRWRPDGDAPPRPVVDTIRAPEARTAQPEPREVDSGGKGNGKGKGKGKERAHAAEDEPMDVDVEVDVEVVDATADPGESSRSYCGGRTNDDFNQLASGARSAGVDDASPQLALPPLPPSLRRVQGSPRFALQTSLLNPQLAAGTSPSTSFARLSLVSPHPGAGGARPAWFAANTGGGGPSAGEAEAVQTADAEPLPPAETPADPSPRVRFVEPEGHVEEQPHSPHDDQDQHQDIEEEDMLLLDVGAEEPYRPSPASPSPAPESDEEIAVTPEIAPRPLEEEEREKETQVVVDEAPQKPDEDVHESSMPVERDASAPVEEAVSAPAEPAVAPPMETTVPEPASPVEGSVASDTVRSPEVPATAAPVALTMKEWTARKRKQREAEKALEDERAQREAEERAVREQELEKEREKDAQGEDKENAVGHKPDRLTRYLDDLGSVARAVVDKSSQRELPAQGDVEMADAAPLLPVQEAPSEEPEVVVEKFPPKPKGTPLTMTSFVSTGGHGRLSPLTVSSVVDSRTPSPGLANGGSNVKREPSPLVMNGIVPPAVNGMPSPAMPNGVSKPATLSSVDASPPPPAVSPIPKPVLQSPKAPRYLSPTFTSNGVQKSAPAAFAKALPVPSQSSSPSFTSNGIHRLPAASPKPPAFSPPPSSPSFRLHARAPSQEEGEILPSSSPPPPRSMFVFGAQAPRTSPFSAPSAPPTQPRSHQQQHGRMPPSAPKALREAQNPLVGGASAGGRVRGGGSHFGGLGPSNFPNNSSFENQQSQQNQQNQQRGNRRPNHFRPRRRNG